VGTAWIQCGCSVSTVWVQYGYSVSTVWVQYGYSMSTVWVQYEYSMGTAWVQHGYSIIIHRIIPLECAQFIVETKPLQCHSRNKVDTAAFNSIPIDTKQVAQ
jgi:hypothetical protein